jgi:hypothetical protein
MGTVGTFNYSATATCDRPTAMALLSDLTRQGELHPLITKVAEQPAAPGAIASYAITDRLRWGPFTFPITYHADVLSITDDDIVTVARQSPATTVTNHTRVFTDGDTVRVDVEVTLQAPSVLFSYAFRVAKKAHLELGERIGETLTRLGSAAR